MSAMLIAALLGAMQALAAPEPIETRCGYMIERGGRVERMAVPELHVLRQTAGNGPFAPGIPAGSSVQCVRWDIVPAANDWKVVAAGHPLYIVQVMHATEPRLAVLEILDGQVRYRFLRGRMTVAEEPRVQARLNAFQLHSQR